MKRVLGSLLGIILLLAAVTALAFKFSPWPSVMVFNYMFSKGDQASESALAKHVPAGIVTRARLAYGPGPDETYDVYYAEAAHGPQPTVVWVHGGGWIAGSTQGVANYLRVLAGQGYTTVAVEYSTGYGSVYPQPVRQVNSALEHLERHAAELHVDPQFIVLAGDSAGAQIAGQVALLTTDADYARAVGIAAQFEPGQIAALLLLSGAYDLDAVNYHGDYAWFLKTVLWAYSGTEDFRTDPYFRLMSITPHASGAFPPSFISSGNGDPLEPQAVALARKLAGLGVRVETLFFPGHAPPLGHEYQFNLDTDAGRQALQRMVAFLAAVRAARSRTATHDVAGAVAAEER